MPRARLSGCCRTCGACSRSSRRHRGRLLLGLSCLLATTAFSVANPWVLRHAIDDLAVAVTRAKLWLYAGLIVALIAVEGFFRYHMRMILIGISREMEYELRNAVLLQLTLLPPAYYQRNRIGELMSRASNDMSAVRMVLGPGIMYTANTVASFVGAVSLMAAISPRLTALALVPLVRSRCSSATSAGGSTTSSRRCRRSSPRSARWCRRTWRARAWCAPTRRRRTSRRASPRPTRSTCERNRRLIRTTGIVHPGIQFLMGLGGLTVLWLGGRMVIAGERSRWASSWPSARTWPC